MKIAVFHNYMDNIGGAEIVALTLARELEADIYTTNISAEKISRMGFADVLDRIYSLGKIPKQAPFRQQLALGKFRHLNLSKKYDFFIIAGDWAMSGAVNNKPNLWYAHSPLNELWEFQDFIKKNVLSFWKRYPYDLWVWFNRKLTLKYAESVDIWVCNSENTKKRIKKFYNKEAVVINPPINVKDYKWQEPKDYWLSVNRLITHKRIDLQTEAFKYLPAEKLVIVGSYEKTVTQFENYKNYIEKTKPNNVEIIHWADNQKLKQLYSECKGLIATAKDEDFGLTVVEAMAAGKPVIAPNEGGYKETIINENTGILIDDINPEKIAETIKKISAKLKDNPIRYREECLNQAKKFDSEKFIEKIKIEINKHK